MALSPLTKILISVFAQLKPDGDEGGGKIAEVSIDVGWASGNGNNQANGLFGNDTRTLAASANEDIDFTTILDGNGNALNAEDIAALIIECPQSNQGDIQARDSSANPWTGWLASSGATDDATLTIKPGAAVVLVSPIAGSYPVNAGSRVLNFINLDGSNPNDYTITAVVRQP